MEANHWNPSQPVLTDPVMEDLRKERILEGQRARRRYLRRIDYYPSPEAAAAIDAHCHASAGGDYSSVIDRLVLAGRRRRASGIK